jgi:hypothetical protein
MWILTLRGEYKSRASKNKVLGNIFGPTNSKVRGKQRQFVNEKLQVLHTDQIMLN